MPVSFDIKSATGNYDIHIGCGLSEAVLAGQQRIVASWKVTLPASTDVRGDDRLTVGARSFEVIAIRGAETRETARVCLCQER